MTKLLLLAITLLSTSSFLSQNEYQIPKYDSTFEHLNSDRQAYQIDYFKNKTLVMQKFYPINLINYDFCGKEYHQIDSIWGILKKRNTLISFNSNEKKQVEKSIWSWDSESNLVEYNHIDYYGKKTRAETYSYTANLKNDFPPCWGKRYEVAVEQRLQQGKFTTITNFDTGQFLYGARDTIYLNPSFVQIAAKAKKILEESYSSEIIKNNLIFSSRRSIYHVNTNDDFRESHNYNSRKQIMNYDIWDIKSFTYVDLAFDLQIENYRFPSIYLRLDSNGNLINKEIDQFDAVSINSSIGLLENKLTTIVPPSKVKKLAYKYSKWAIEGNTTIDLIWTSKTPQDSLGLLMYCINYDRIDGLKGRYYARQIQINATNGEYIREIEVKEGFQNPKLSSRISKWIDQSWKYGYGNLNNPQIPIIYDQLPINISSFMLTKKEGLFGIINSKNETLLEFEYDSIGFIETKLERYKNLFVLVQKEEKIGVYSRRRGLVTDIKFTGIKENELEQLVLIAEDGTELIYNMRTETIEE